MNDSFKVEVILDHKILHGILDVGDVVEIGTIRTKEEVVISWNYEKDGPLNKYGHQPYKKTTPKEVRPAGDYKDYSFKSKNGHYYTGTIVGGWLGPTVAMGDIFKKL